MNFNQPFLHPLGVPAVRPNTPVLPFGAISTRGSFIDPSVNIIHGSHTIVGYRDFIAPFATLDATTGFVRIGNGSVILDNAVIQSNPQGVKNPTTSVVIGDNVSIDYGATVLGPSTIGSLDPRAAATEVGPNAVVDGATIEPGAIVGALARVGPGVTVPTGFMVLPGSNVTTNAQASNPALGMVTPVTSAQYAALTAAIANNLTVASADITLYQGLSATGATPAVSTSGVFNGNLTNVEGASPELSSTPSAVSLRTTPTNGSTSPANVIGSPTGPAFEPTNSSTSPGPIAPVFLAPRGQEQPGLIASFRARVVGQVLFLQRAALVAHHLGFHNSIRADQGQPITIGSILKTGNGVTINSPLTSTSTSGTNGNAPLTFDQNFQAGDHAVILGDQGVNTNIGDNVSIGAGAVVDSTTIGPNSTVGPRAYLLNSTFPAGSNIPAGAIYINNRFQGFVQT